MPPGLAVSAVGTLRVVPEDCQDGFLCIPCYDPTDGVTTGAWDAPGDAPVTPPPVQLRYCGGFDGGPSNGYCVPFVAAEAWGLHLQYRQEDCEASELCIPTFQVMQPGDCFAPCATGLGGSYDPGACLPSYYVRDQGAAELAVLRQSTCTYGDVCVPCLDPLHAGAPTRAC